MDLLRNGRYRIQRTAWRLTFPEPGLDRLDARQILHQIHILPIEIAANGKAGPIHLRTQLDRRLPGSYRHFPSKHFIPAVAGPDGRTIRLGQEPARLDMKSKRLVVMRRQATGDRVLRGRDEQVADALRTSVERKAESPERRAQSFGKRIGQRQPPFLRFLFEAPVLGNRGAVHREWTVYRRVQAAPVVPVCPMMPGLRFEDIVNRLFVRLKHT